jgi:hypothetical protein
MEMFEILQARNNFNFDPLLMYVCKITDTMVQFEIPGEIWDNIQIEEDSIRRLQRIFEFVGYSRPISEDFLNMRIPMSKKMPIVYLTLANPINNKHQIT